MCLVLIMRLVVAGKGKEGLIGRLLLSYTIRMIEVCNTNYVVCNFIKEIVTVDEVLFIKVILEGIVRHFFYDLQEDFLVDVVCKNNIDET